MEFSYLSEKNPKNDLNEDNFLVEENIFGVFDGVTGLNSYKDATGKTGGYLASSITKDTFIELEQKISLRECAMEANKRILKKMNEAGIDVSRKEDLWGTTATVVKINTEDFEWIGTGDSPLIVIYND